MSMKWIVKTKYSILSAIILFFISYSNISATTYYVANAGNDSCNGQSQTIGTSGTCA